MMMTLRICYALVLSRSFSFYLSRPERPAHQQRHSIPFTTKAPRHHRTDRELTGAQFGPTLISWAEDPGGIGINWRKQDACE
jgi:hypothetical protein